jgi:hypothetical protein
MESFGAYVGAIISAAITKTLDSFGQTWETAGVVLLCLACSAVAWTFRRIRKGGFKAVLKLPAKGREQVAAFGTAAVGLCVPIAIMFCLNVFRSTYEREAGRETSRAELEAAVAASSGLAAEVDRLKAEVVRLQNDLKSTESQLRGSRATNAELRSKQFGPILSVADSFVRKDPKTNTIELLFSIMNFGSSGTDATFTRQVTVDGQSVDDGPGGRLPQSLFFAPRQTRQLRFTRRLPEHYEGIWNGTKVLQVQIDVEYQDQSAKVVRDRLYKCRLNPRSSVLEMID